MRDYSYKKLDAVYHSRIRLAIAAALAGAGEMDFTSLRDIVGATDGNMNTHLRKLEDAGYVIARKQFVGRKPLTSYKLSDAGRKSFKNYLDVLESFVE